MSVTVFGNVFGKGKSKSIVIKKTHMIELIVSIGLLYLYLKSEALAINNKFSKCDFAFYLKLSKQRKIQFRKKFVCFYVARKILDKNILSEFYLLLALKTSSHK